MGTLSPLVLDQIGLGESLAHHMHWVAYLAMDEVEEALNEVEEALDKVDEALDEVEDALDEVEMLGEQACSLRFS